MTLDSFDKKLLLQLAEHRLSGYSPGSPDARKRLDELVSFGFARSEPRPHDPRVGDQPPPRYFLTEKGADALRKA
jgi:hypothetical protein